MNSTKVAFITGGSRGIGLGVAKELATVGFRVAINGIRDPLEVAEPLNELRAIRPDTIYVRGDVADLSQHARMIDEVRKAFGRLDVLVNNAGVAPSIRADTLENTPENFDRVMNINLRGPFFLTQAAANWMVAQRKADPTFRGCIVNVSSVSATAVSTNRSEYCISKAGIAMATQVWAARLAEFGIDVYEVRPGVITTDMTAGVKEKYDRLIASGLTVEPRWGTPQDVGKAVAVLARGDLPYATGQVLKIDGGITLQRM